MAAALPPGAWWETANRGGVAGPPEPYGPYAGDAAVAAARRGNLELRGLQFAYPLRPNVPGKPACCKFPCNHSALRISRKFVPIPAALVSCLLHTSLDTHAYI